MKSPKILWAAGLLLSFNVLNANATLVSVTANFTKFTFDYDTSLYYSPFIVNGQDITEGTTTDLSGSSVSFGVDDQRRFNVFSFTGNQTDLAGSGIANQFNLGTFTYTNGTWYIGADTFIDFTLTTHSSDATLDGHTFDGRINFSSSDNSHADPEGSADYFVVQDPTGGILTSLGSVRVYDYNYCPPGNASAPNCNTGSVDVIGHINSLHLDSFTNPTGGAFIDASTIPPLARVPEPSIVFLFASGLLGILGTRKKLTS